MLSSAKTNLVENHDATMSNLKLLLQTWKGSLYGDPFYGTNMLQKVFSQNDLLLVDIIIDDIYTAILNFMPQIYVERKQISLRQKDDKIFVEINCINKLNNETNMYEISLTDDAQN